MHYAFRHLDEGVACGRDVDAQVHRPTVMLAWSLLLGVALICYISEAGDHLAVLLFQAVLTTNPMQFQYGHYPRGPGPGPLSQRLIDLKEPCRAIGLRAL